MRLPDAEPTAQPISHPGSSPRFYLPALDGLRTIAFLMVWCAHAFSPEVPIGASAVFWHNALLQTGPYGVPIFFVLSAFLITRLLLMEKERMGRIDLRAYYVRRTLRIWPLYFLVVALATVDWHFRDGVPVPAVVSLATFTANWYEFFTKGLTNFSIVLWSVSVEEQFYLVWPLVLSCCSIKGLRGVCYAMIAVAIVSRALVAHFTHDAVPVWYATTSYLDALALGTLLALGMDRLPKPSRAVWYAAWFACFALLVLQAGVFPVWLRNTAYTPLSSIGFVGIPLIATLIVGLAATAKGTFLENRTLVHVGRLTFGMYCFHAFVLRALPSGPRYLVASLFITYALAWISFRFYESRFLKLKHRFERVSTAPAN